MGDVETAKADYKFLSPWNNNNKKKGGFRACMFVYVMVGLENMGFIANMVSLVLYFNYVMHFDNPTAATTLTNFMGSTFLLSLVGGFISDTYLNRLHTVLIFGSLEIVALILVIVQSYSKDLQPDSCGKPSCVEGRIAVMFYASLCILALGSGGVRGALPALGADQFNQRDPEEAKALASFFNWTTLSSVLGASVGVTCIVWVSMNKGWYKGFIISTVATFAGFIVLALGKPFYLFRQLAESPFIRISQVIALAIKNRKLPFPQDASELYEVSDKAAVYRDEKIAHTDQFRFLDKAAILPKGSIPEAGKVCTVTQVEEVKILTRMLPILASTIIMNTCLAQLQTFSVEQGSRMNLHLGKFEVPAASIPVIPLSFMCILIPIYEFVFVPFARKITGHPSGITQLQRVGIGLVLSAISMAVAALVEVKRRNQAIKDLYHPISLFWLSFQYGIFGIADMFTLVGLMEFFYREAPAGMKSLSLSFTWLSLSLGYFLSTVLVNMINAITKRVTPSKQPWIHGIDLNSNKLDLFYWFLAILSCLNFAVYLYWASWYKYKPDDSTQAAITKAGSDGLSLIANQKEGSTTESNVASVVNPTEEESKKVAMVENTKEEAAAAAANDDGKDNEAAAAGAAAPTEQGNDTNKENGAS